MLGHRPICRMLRPLKDNVIYTPCFKKGTPETFYYNFAKIALISIKIGTHNLHMMKLNYNIIRQLYT